MFDPIPECVGFCCAPTKRNQTVNQVDSAAATLAVNYWWSSQLSAALQAVPHLHHYYLRLLQVGPMWRTGLL
jgi:hypothetical protein